MSKGLYFNFSSLEKDESFKSIDLFEIMMMKSIVKSDKFPPFNSKKCVNKYREKLVRLLKGKNKGILDCKSL